MKTALLLVDAGNTRIKWALVEGAEPGALPVWGAAGECRHEQIVMLDQAWDGLQFSSIWAVNVAGPVVAGRIAQLADRLRVGLRFVQSAPTACGVINRYTQPEQLGADRWAALIGAWKRRHGTCLVVSAGTAVTIDALNADGEFIGGMIVPGRRLMLGSLAAGTHALEVVEGQVQPWPRNTADALSSGVAHTLAAAIHEAYLRLASMTDSSPDCLITGGDADWLKERLAIGCSIAPRLILEGLLEMALEEMETC